MYGGAFNAQLFLSRHLVGGKIALNLVKNSYKEKERAVSTKENLDK